MAKLTFKEIVLRFALMLAAVLAFTGLDWFVHQSHPTLSVPSWYFTNKILYGTLWAFLSSLTFRTQGIPKQAALITFITVSLLQINYIMSGYYTLFFHAVVYTEHLVFLYLTSFIALKTLSRIR